MLGENIHFKFKSQFPGIKILNKLNWPRQISRFDKTTVIYDNSPCALRN